LRSTSRRTCPRLRPRVSHLGSEVDRCAPQNPEPSTPPPASAPRPQWPRVIGTIGIILGIFIFLDQVDDLLLLTWTEEDWRRIFAPGIADLIAQATPSVGWRLFSSVIQMGLGVLLFVGSLALRRRSRSGVFVCRLWAWLAIGWTVLTIGWAIWWLQRYAGEIPGLSEVSWQGYAAFGIVLALVLLLAYPVFLLVWFSKLDVQTEYKTWRD
jgi:hypothetical protein